ncbi:hypothetical protein RJT34_23841 [Clitoria ternatea]|uniref:Uncharacterized protein n=1 Tax=Clitoria ternatea TaxID=43366 RepID=A0AAN9FT13_CLITE
MKTEPAASDYVINNNDDNNSSQNNVPLNPYFCPYCSVMFDTETEMLTHYYQEINQLYTLEMMRRRVIDLYRLNPQIQVPYPLQLFSFLSYPVNPMILSHVQFLFDNVLHFPPSHPVFQLETAGASSAGKDHEMVDVNPTLPPSPPSPDQVDQEGTRSLISFLDLSIAPPTTYPPVTSRSHRVDVNDGLEGMRGIPLPPNAPVPATVVPSFVGHVNFAPAAAITGVAVAPPLVAPATMTVRRVPSEPNMNLEL